MSRVNNLKAFIDQAMVKHNGKYDYSKSIYTGSKEKLVIICPEHGEFLQTPNCHLKGQGCPMCALYKKQHQETVLGKEKFAEKARIVHGDKYDYSQVVYKCNKKKVKLICPKHGEFWQRPDEHLRGYGCNKCGYELAGNLSRKPTEQFVKEAKQVHGDKYDYSKVNYINAATKVCIICPRHGEFWQRPYGHLNGFGCAECSGKKHLTTEEFIEKAQMVHGGMYDYSNVNYTNIDNNVQIICPKHGEFWQKAYYHLRGSNCPNCAISSKLESDLVRLFESNNIDYQRQKGWQWLGLQRIDFYLPKYNIGIECQGLQHFEPVEFFGGEEGFEYRKECDKRKRERCKENGIKLLYYIPFDEYLLEERQSFKSGEEIVRFIKSFTKNETDSENK